MSRAAHLASLALPSAAIALGIHVVRSGWAAFLLYHATIVIVLTATRGWPAARRGLTAAPSDRRAVVVLSAIGVAAALVGAGLMWVLWPWYAGHSRALAPALAKLGLHGAAWTAFALYHSLVNPIVEEVYWRGALGEREGIVRTSDVWFAAYHGLVLVAFTGDGPVVLSLVVLTAIAAFWRWTHRRSGSLWPAVISHLAADAGIMLVAALRMRG